MPSLADKLIRGSFLRILNLVLNIAVAFFMIPYVINAIGDRWYGLWVIVGTLVGYYGFFELGISTANERFIARAIGKEDRNEIEGIFNTTFFIFLLVAVVAFLVSVAIAIIAPRFFNNPEEIRIFRIVILVVGFNTALSFPVRSVYGFLYAHVRYDIVNLIGITKLLIRTFLIVYFLKHGYGIVSLAIITLCVEVLQYALNIIYMTRRYPDISLHRSHVSKDIIRQLIGYSVFSFISNTAKQLRFHVDSFVISGFLGLSLVTHFNIASRVAQYYLMIVTSAVALMKPVFSSLEGRGDFEQIRDKFIFMSKINTMLSVFIGGSILIFGKAFIIAWMGEEYTDSCDVLLVLTVGLIFNTIQVTPVTLLYGISKHKFYSILMVTEGLIHLLLSVILVKRFGIIGAAFGSAIPMLITSVFIIPVYASRVIDLRFWDYVRVVGKGIILGGMIHFVSWFVIRDMILSSYMRIFILGAATSSLFIISNVLVLFSKEERRFLKIPF